MRSLAPSVAMALTVLVSGAACGSDDGRLRSADVVEEEPAVVHPLPFGLEQVEGTEPIARPLVFEHVPVFYDEQPVPADALRIAYRVTSDDPGAVLRRWADQLVSLELGDVRILAMDSPSHGPWASARTYADWDRAGPGPGYGQVELWATQADPILLVTVDRHLGVEPVASAIVEVATLPPPPTLRVAAKPPAPGDELFVEQTNPIHLPASARALMPTIPTDGGTGGSTSLLMAADEEAVVAEMLAEAVTYSDFHDVQGPEVEEQDGWRVTTGSFVIPAGGWAFRVVAARGPDDAEAVLWVQSWAD